jgi:peptidoglycan/LPS O-acetylase OafA/YrhL
VAALTVVCCHLINTLFPGQTAVVFFFVLSGFLITWLIEADIAQTGTLNLRGFYARRARRLLPTFYTWWVLCAAASLVVLHAIPRNLIAAALYMSDFTQGIHADNRFYELSWSLSIEEKFYLLWPPIIIALRRRANFQRWLWAVILLVQAARIPLTYIHYDMAYYSFPWRLDALLVGCSLAIRLRERRPLPHWLFVRYGWVAPVCVFGLCISRDINKIVAVGLTLTAYASACLILQVIARPPAILNNPAMDYLGKISYSLYLYHALVYFWFQQHPNALPVFWQGLTAIAISIGIASAAYFLVELPYRQRRESSVKST